MNLADYLSELLGQQDEVSLPGLGYFVRERVNGYYDEKDEKFYPPYHHVKFVPELKDDDTFAQYVANKKNISLASSKYFTEKFVSKLKEDAAKGKYPFSDLGSFYTDQDQLVFKPNEKIASDPSFYGYPPVNISKVGNEPEPVIEQVTPAVAETSSPQELSPSPIKTLRQLQQEQYIEEEYEEKKSINGWWIVLIAVCVVALGLFALYKLYPSAFDRLKASYHRTFTKESAIVPPVSHIAKPDTLNPDTVIKAAPSTDTLSKAVPPAGSGQGIAIADTANLPRFELVVASFKALRSATKELETYKARGLNAKVFRDTPGHVKISVGTFPSSETAQAAKDEYIKLGKIPNDSIILEIKPHK